MEGLYSGRAILNETFNELEIIIPAKKNWFAIIFLGAWLGGWAIGEIFATGALISMIGEGIEFPVFFIFFWLCGWTVGGFLAIKTFIWNLIGKELISFAQGQLTIAKKGSLFSKSITFEINNIKKIRAQEVEIPFGSRNGGRTSFGGLNGSNGTIRFDYGLKTVKFADGIDEAEANFILEKLKIKKIISKENL